MSQLDVARMSAVGEKVKSETVSSGGLAMATSFFRSPIVVVLVEAAAEVLKMPDMVADYTCRMIESCMGYYVVASKIKTNHQQREPRYWRRGSC